MLRFRFKGGHIHLVETIAGAYQHHVVLLVLQEGAHVYNVRWEQLLE